MNRSVLKQEGLFPGTSRRSTSNKQISRIIYLYVMVMTDTTFFMSAFCAAIISAFPQGVHASSSRHSTSKPFGSMKQQKNSTQKKTTQNADALPPCLVPRKTHPRHIKEYHCYRSKSPSVRKKYRLSTYKHPPNLPAPPLSSRARRKTKKGPPEGKSCPPHPLPTTHSSLLQHQAATRIIHHTRKVWIRQFGGAAWENAPAHRGPPFPAAASWPR